jgi:hypothetical protein
MIGRFQRVNNGKEVKNTGLITNEVIMTKLSPFVNSATLTITAGTSPKPDGFIYRLSVLINGYEAEKIDQDQVSAVTHSVIDPPSVLNNKYYFTESKNGYTFLPSSLTTGTLKYIKVPTKVVWGFTYVDDRPVYDAGTSVQPEWDDISCMEIIKRMVRNAGVEFKDADFANFGNVAVNTGE